MLGIMLVSLLNHVWYSEKASAPDGTSPKSYQS